MKRLIDGSRILTIMLVSLLATLVGFVFLTMILGTEALNPSRPLGLLSMGLMLGLLLGVCITTTATYLGSQRTFPVRSPALIFVDKEDMYSLRQVITPYRERDTRGYTVKYQDN